MLDTIFPLNQDLTRLTDRARQRNYTHEESTIIASSARLREMGCDILEWLKESEADIVSTSLSSPTAANVGEHRESLKYVMEVILRQAAFAMATDSTESYGKALVTLKPLFWTSEGPTSEMTQAAFESLRSEVRRSRTDYASGRLDEYLKIATRFFTVAAEIGFNRDQILAKSADELLARHPDLDRNFPRVREKISDDQEKFLEYSLYCILPEGSSHIYELGTTFHQACLKAKFDPTMMVDSVTILRKHLHREAGKQRLGEFLQHFREVTEYICALADSAFHRDAILEETQNYCQALSGEQNQAFDTDIIKDFARIFDLSAISSYQGSFDYVFMSIEEIGLEWNRRNLPPEVVCPGLARLLSIAENRLSSMTLIQTQHHLHRFVQYFSQVVNLAKHRETILTSVADSLEDTFPEFFRRHFGAKAYVMRDQEQLLYNTSLMLLPESELLTIGRFSAFGEFLADFGFKKELMFKSFELLERTIIATYDRHSLAYFLPIWKGVRKYLEAVCALPACYKKVVDETTKIVTEKFPSDIDRFPNGREKVQRDIRAMLHGALVPTLLNGGKITRRGMAHFIESVLETHMNRDMLDLTYKTLIEQLNLSLDQEHSGWICDNLEKLRKTIVAACAIAPKMESITSTTAKAIISKYPRLEAKYSEAERRSAEDFEHLLKRATLSLCPTGDEWMARGTWNFANSIMLAGYPASMIPDAYDELLKGIENHIDTDVAQYLLPQLRNFKAIVQSFVDLAQTEKIIISETLDQVFTENPTLATKYHDSRQKTSEDLSDTLRYAIMADMPGGDWWARRYARVQYLVYNKSRFDSSVIEKAYGLLIKTAGAKLPSTTSRSLLPRLEAIRDYLVLIAEIAPHEEVIVRAVIDQMSAKYGARYFPDTQSLEVGTSNAKLILRTSVMAMFPQCSLFTGEVAAVIRSTGVKEKVDADYYSEMATLLQNACKTKLQQGHFDTLNKNIEGAVATISVG